MAAEGDCSLDWSRLDDPWFRRFHRVRMGVSSFCHFSFSNLAAPVRERDSVLGRRRRRRRNQKLNTTCT